MAIIKSPCSTCGFNFNYNAERARWANCEVFGRIRIKKTCMHAIPRAGAVKVRVVEVVPKRKSILDWIGV